MSTPSVATELDLDAGYDAKLAALADPAGAVAALEAGLSARGLRFGEQPIPTYLRPHLLSAARAARWDERTEAFFALLEEVAARALADPAIARALGFDEPALALCRIDPGYRRFVVVARPDAIPIGPRFRFIEVNSDSPAMMTFADALAELLFELPPLAAERARYEGRNRVQALLEALTACYREWGGKGAPAIAIVDWPGEKTAHELALTAARFTALGAEAVVASPHELALEGGRLRARGRPIDLVYRRVLFRDFLTRKDELAPLLTAYRDGAVCVANPLRSYLVGTKALLALLHDPADPVGLSPDERALVEELVPETHRVTEANAPPAADRAGFVLKKTESYGGKDVVLGAACDEASWQEALSAARAAPWVVQRFEPMPMMALPVLEGGRFVFQRKFMNWNPFVFGGRSAGSIARVSDSMLINISQGGGLLPTLRVP
jgi:hypothetical protein